MRRSLVLRTNPSVRQMQSVLARLEGALIDRGAVVRRHSAGDLEFTMPPPWKLGPGWLALISGGTATLSAWGGGPWRISYSLRFKALRLLTVLMTVVLAVVGWGWPRLALLSAILALWLAGSGTLHLLAAHAFRRFLRDMLGDVVERRERARTPDSGSRAAQQPD